MFISTIDNILEPRLVERVSALLAEGSFTTGRISGGTDDTKLNQELPGDDPRYLEALRFVESSVRDNEAFNFTAFPRFMTRPIFSRYLEGMFYKEHTDFPLMNFYSPGPKPTHRQLAPLGANYVRADLSMTLFLSDPSTYDGGELAFANAQGERRFKLPAGSGVIYPTGSRHAVRTVTRGQRCAAIFWIQSIFPVESQREGMNNLYRLSRRLSEQDASSELAELSEDAFYGLFRSLAEV